MKRLRDESDDTPSLPVEKTARCDIPVSFPYEALLPEMRGEVRGHMSGTTRHLLKLTSRGMLQDDDTPPPIPSQLRIMARWRQWLATPHSMGIPKRIFTQFTMWDRVFDDCDDSIMWRGRCVAWYTHAIPSYEKGSYRVMLKYNATSLYHSGFDNFFIHVDRIHLPFGNSFGNSSRFYQQEAMKEGTPERLDALREWVLSSDRTRIPACLL